MNASLFLDWSWQSTTWSILIVITSAISTVAMIILLLPVFRRYALARPNGRSNHRVPTPQGGGFAVITITFGLFLLYYIIFSSELLSPSIIATLGASIGLLIIGGVDDIRPSRAI